MPGSTHRLQANFTLSIGKEFPAIPGLQTMAFFGTGYDGNEANRVAGGPALSVLQGTPAHAVNYVSVGLQAGGTRNDVIDTNNPRDASWIASGWTGMAACRAIGSSGNYAVVLSDQNSSSASPGQAGTICGFGLQANNNRLILFGNSLSNRGLIQFTQPAGSWHICAYTVPATAAAGLPTQAWEFTENQAGQSISFALTSTLIIPAPAMSPHFGCHSTELSSGQGPIDVTWGLIAKGVLSQSAMAAIASSARAWLARRQIVC